VAGHRNDPFAAARSTAAVEGSAGSSKTRNAASVAEIASRLPARPQRGQ